MNDLAPILAVTIYVLGFFITFVLAARYFYRPYVSDKEKGDDKFVAFSYAFLWPLSVPCGLLVLFFSYLYDVANGR